MNAAGTPPAVRRRAQILGAVASVFVFIASSAAQNQFATLKQAGPRHLIIAMHCKPADRPGFRTAVAASLRPRLERLAHDGKLQSYRLLFSRFADSDAWDALLVLGFVTDDGMQSWADLEKTAPAGLDPQTAKLLSGIASYEVDDASHSEAPTPAARPIYLVIPYTIDAPSVDEYVKYAEGYVVPQLQGWMKEGVLSRWDLLIVRYYAGRPWQSVLMLEYRDANALGQRERVVARVRSELAENPDWEAISDNKRKMRTELRAVVADELLASSD